VKLYNLSFRCADLINPGQEKRQNKMKEKKEEEEQCVKQADREKRNERGSSQWIQGMGKKILCE
jgi:hypothetical protein